MWWKELLHKREPPHRPLGQYKEEASAWDAHLSTTEKCVSRIANQHYLTVQHSNLFHNNGGELQCGKKDNFHTLFKPYWFLARDSSPPTYCQKKEYNTKWNMWEEGGKHERIFY